MLDERPVPSHIYPMGAALPYLILIAMVATVGVLAFGLVSMVRGGDFDARNSNRLMRLRVMFQFIAIVLLGIAFLFSSK